MEYSAGKKWYQRRGASMAADMKHVLVRLRKIRKVLQGQSLLSTKGMEGVQRKRDQVAQIAKSRKLQNPEKEQERMNR